MKKLIMVVLSIILVLATSVNAFASTSSTFVEWEVIDTIVNAEYNSQNCGVVYYPTFTPIPTMYDSLGNLKTQITTYNVLYSLYENLTLNGVSLMANKLTPTIVEWYEYGGYCWILLTADVTNGIIGSNRSYWVSNFAGKILYCEAPEEEETYTLSAIAGADPYCITDREPGTVGGGYLGDLQLPSENMVNIHSILTNLGSAASFYSVYRSIDGEGRYYMMCTYPNRSVYYVCNKAGQLYYSVKQTGTTTPDDGGGSVFDATEVITAINSVYDAINSQGSLLRSAVGGLMTTANTISADLSQHMNNMVSGFDGISGRFDTLLSYFEDLSGLFPVENTITLTGTDTRMFWDAGDRITDVKLSGITDDLIIKEYLGDLVNESGYEHVSLSEADTEYMLTTDENGYRRIIAANEYDVNGSPVPDSTLFYFTFDDTLKSNIDDFTLYYPGTPAYAEGVNGNAFVFGGGKMLSSNETFDYTFANNSFTISFWVYFKTYPSGTYNYHFSVGTSGTAGDRVQIQVYSDGHVYYANNSVGFAGDKIALNEWNHFAVTCDGVNLYGFLNGNLDGSAPYTGVSGLSGRFQLGGGVYELSAGSMIDDMIIINGNALWTDSFDSSKVGIFGAIATDYFLPCEPQSMTLNFDNTLSIPFTPADESGTPIPMGRIEDDFSYIYRDIDAGIWKCHDPQTQNKIILSAENQSILNDTIYIRQSYTQHAPDTLTPENLQLLFPIDDVVYLDIPNNGSITITYDHYAKWFRMMYLLMDKQNKLLSNMGSIDQTIVNIENTVVDISQDNDAFNVFYITKSDGATESVGDAATDVVKVVGDILSMFYRLVFDDGLEHTDILNDFEAVYTADTLGVSVW